VREDDAMSDELKRYQQEEKTELSELLDKYIEKFTLANALSFLNEGAVDVAREVIRLWQEDKDLEMALTNLAGAIAQLDQITKNKCPTIKIKFDKLGRLQEEKQELDKKLDQTVHSLEDSRVLLGLHECIVDLARAAVRTWTSGRCSDKVMTNLASAITSLDDAISD